MALNIWICFNSRMLPECIKISKKNFFFTCKFNFGIIELNSGFDKLKMFGISPFKKKWAASWQNQQNDLCAQQRLRSAWTSAQSDQSLCCPHEEALGPQLPIERTAKTLIRLDGCPGWSQSSLGAKVILLVLSWGGSNKDLLDLSWYFESLCLF